MQMIYIPHNYSFIQSLFAFPSPQTEPWRFVVLRRADGAIQRLNEIKCSYMEASLQKQPVKLAAFRSKMDRKRANNAKVQFMIVIVVKNVTNSKGKHMPVWEEVAATACAVQNMHLALTAKWQEGYGGYWTSGGTAFDGWFHCREALAFLGIKWPCSGGAVVEEQAQGPAGDEMWVTQPRRDRVLGAFVLGSCPAERMNKYRARREPFANKLLQPAV